MTMDKYIVFILSHGRANKVDTFKTLRDQGYTGRIGIVIDDEDEQGDAYRKKFGKDNVFVFNKAEVAKRFDEVIKGDRRTVVYARNACFDIARLIGIKYFIELDDDYSYFSYTFDSELEWCRKREKKTIHDLDAIFSSVWDFYLKTNAASVALAQGGDFIGGGDAGNTDSVKLLRKAMNSFFCSTDRPFNFTGRINEDVNTYTMEAHRGMLFFTVNQIGLNQGKTQSNKGGMTEVYLDSGTYLKSFFSVIVCPSAVKVRMMGAKQRRLHHSVSWNNCAPKLIAETYKKKRVL